MSSSSFHLNLDREEARVIAELAGLGLTKAEQRHRDTARKGPISSIEPEDDSALYHSPTGACAQGVWSRHCRSAFEVAVYDEFEEITEGENERLIVSIDKC